VVVFVIVIVDLSLLLKWLWLLLLIGVQKSGTFSSQALCNFLIIVFLDLSSWKGIMTTAGVECLCGWYCCCCCVAIAPRLQPFHRRIAP
jgi:hypothetical protein